MYLLTGKLSLRCRQADIIATVSSPLSTTLSKKLLPMPLIPAITENPGQGVIAGVIVTGNNSSPVSSHR